MISMCLVRCPFCSRAFRPGFASRRLRFFGLTILALVLDGSCHVAPLHLLMSVSRDVLRLARPSHGRACCMTDSARHPTDVRDPLRASLRLLRRDEGAQVLLPAPGGERLELPQTGGTQRPSQIVRYLECFDAVEQRP